MTQKTFTETDFIKATGADHTAMAKLRHYHKLLLEWNPKINLVSASTLNEAWGRHFLDSAQIGPRPEVLGQPEQLSCLTPWALGLGPSIADLGSGAGFPGLVLAVMGVPNITLIERDIRKGAFLRTVAAETKTKVEILSSDIKAIKNRQFDVITSRAMADVGELLSISEPLRKPSTSCLFLKGKNLDAELALAQKDWSMQVYKKHSLTDNEAFIVQLSHVKRY
ncbi:MAG: 16S rRNA (guanine(527)-N(7))-methyltransferase RsmG [Alphaproteobacteria bacterium]|nr:16S rRNA (guanine(527)-N(7))-methyltransferase RsmG [Alphaproteobacteria bacterium]